MTELCEAHETIYTFRFGRSKKMIQLTEQQLNHFPYLTALVSHTDDFLPVKNDNNEYILNHPIRYGWFKAIFRSIKMEQPSALFTELSQEANVMGMLHLYDYLCIDPLPLPLLKDEKLARSNPVDTNSEGNRSIKYRRANLSEVRNTAVQFIIAMSKNEYDLCDCRTKNTIFSLVMVIFANPMVFHSRFRHHTLAIVNKYCSSLFSDAQQKQLPTTEQIARNNLMDLLICADDNDRSPSLTFDNAFAWKGFYVSKEVYETDLSAKCPPVLILGETGAAKSTMIGYLLGWSTNLWSLSDDDNVYHPVYFPSRNELHPIHPIMAYDTSRFFNLDHVEQDQRQKQQGQSARSGRFNTLPKRPTVDRFKHRSGPKAQKHR